MEISVSLDPSVGVDLKSYLSQMNDILLSLEKGAVSFHIDVMDGKFVGRNSVDLMEYSFIAKTALVPSNVHLMVERPDLRIDEFLSASANSMIDCITFHIETVSAQDALSLLGKIKSFGFGAGVAIDLDTDISDAWAVIRACDVVLVMSVKAGRSGQVFNARSIETVEQVKRINPSVRVILDGGANADNIRLIKRAGVDIVVVGNYIYKAEDRHNTVVGLVELAR